MALAAARHVRWLRAPNGVTAVGLGTERKERERERERETRNVTNTSLH